MDSLKEFRVAIENTLTKSGFHITHKTYTNGVAHLVFQKYAFFFSCSLNELELYSGELGIHAASYSWTLAEPEQRCCVSQFVIDGGRYSIPLRRLLTPLTTVLLEGCREDLLDEIRVNLINK